MNKNKRWFRLDNAAKLYPAVATSRWSSIFRVSVELSEFIDPAILQQAADLVLPRFPALKVRMKTGLFWYYLEEIHAPLSVRPDQGHPCMPFSYAQDHGYLLRIFFYQKRISAEFFHSLTDGSGGLVFIKTLATQYLRLRGYDVKFDQGALHPSDSPDPKEMQDAFMHMPLPRVRRVRRESRAYHFPATPEIPHTLHTIAASIPCDQLLEKARALGVTLTEYLTGVILFTAYTEQEKSPGKGRLPIRVSVPVNMRNFYDTPTLRNFSSFINPFIDPRLGDYTFEEIVRDVHAFMRYHLNPKLLCATIATNVADEKYLLIRLAPLFIKNLVIGSVFRRTGDRAFTSTLTNLGPVKRPTGAEELIRRFEFQLGSPALPLCNCACLSTGNELRLVFSSNIRESTLPREMLRFLVEKGVEITVESNKEE
ncbi:MAG: alcohol acetyltransferase [Clostridiales bacterium]|nr:alcohol acetyltransferase [Clostridiales bacterium]